MSKQPVINDCDLLYYRYAYAVMMDAELKYYKKDYAGALASLNIIAKRAYGIEDFYKTATRDAVLEALVNEYFLEFPAEGVIWWPLHPSGQDLGLQPGAARQEAEESEHPALAYLQVRKEQEP